MVALPPTTVYCLLQYRGVSWQHHEGDVQAAVLSVMQ